MNHFMLTFPAQGQYVLNAIRFIDVSHMDRINIIGSHVDNRFFIPHQYN